MPKLLKLLNLNERSSRFEEFGLKLIFSNRPVCLIYSSPNSRLPSILFARFASRNFESKSLREERFEKKNLENLENLEVESEKASEYQLEFEAAYLPAEGSWSFIDLGMMR